MSVLDLKVIERFVRVCNDGWLQGWHERNGGNLTYRLQADEVEAMRPSFDESGEWVEMGIADATLGGSYFLTTGSGRFFRNVILEPAVNIGVVEIGDKGDRWRIVWGLEQGGRPTSEFPTHYMNHCVRSRATDGKSRVIYHAHTPALIALTYVMPLDAKAITRALWQSATECPVVFPGGVGVVPWMVPGGTSIAEATSLEMEDFEAVLWSHHGLFCSGEDFDVTFGLMHTIEKAADIYLKVLSSGQPILQTITDEDLRAIASDFGVSLREAFLEG